MRSKVFFYSLLVELATCWVLAFNDKIMIWVQSLAYTILVIYIMQRLCVNKNLKSIDIFITSLLVVLGRVVLEIPIRLFYFNSSLGTLLIPISAVLVIIFTTICCVKKNILLIVLSTIIVFLFNVFIVNWYETQFLPRLQP